MNVALSQYQAEEVTVDETNIYSADTEPESTQTEEQESHEAEELNETETFETEEQTQEQTEKSVSQTEVAVQEESTVQYSLLERIEGVFDQVYNLYCKTCSSLYWNYFIKI